MSRTFTETLSPDQLAEKIVKAIEANKGKPHEFEDEIDTYEFIQFIYENQYGLCLPCLTEQIVKDLSKVKFDSENHECEPHEAYCGAGPIAGFRTLSNGLTYLGCIAGGDWETPLFYIIYWDGKKLRGYIPTDGNLWNTDTKMAYGNDEEELEDETLDAKNIKKRFGVDVNYGDFEGNVDCAKVEADIMNRIQAGGGVKPAPICPNLIKDEPEKPDVESQVECEHVLRKEAKPSDIGMEVYVCTKCDKKFFSLPEVN